MFAFKKYANPFRQFLRTLRKNHPHVITTRKTRLPFNPSSSNNGHKATNYAGRAATVLEFVIWKTTSTTNARQCRCICVRANNKSIIYAKPCSYKCARSLSHPTRLLCAAEPLLVVVVVISTQNICNASRAQSAPNAPYAPKTHKKSVTTNVLRMSVHNDRTRGTLLPPDDDDDDDPTVIEGLNFRSQFLGQLF